MIYLDCDGVLLDWEAGFAKWCPLPLDPEGPSSWDISEWTKTSPKEAATLIREFNASPGFAHLEPMPGAVERIHDLWDAGHDLTVITCCSSDPTIARRRRENLCAVFGHVFQRAICLDLGDSKEHVLRALLPGIWIEDNYMNGAGGHWAGHEVLMMRARHNRAHEGGIPALTWCDDWDDLFRQIKALYS